MLNLKRVPISYPKCSSDSLSDNEAFNSGMFITTILSIDYAASQKFYLQIVVLEVRKFMFDMTKIIRLCEGKNIKNNGVTFVHVVTLSLSYTSLFQDHF